MSLCPLTSISSELFYLYARFRIISYKCLWSLPTNLRIACYAFYFFQREANTYFCIRGISQQQMPTCFPSIILIAVQKTDIWYCFLCSNLYVFPLNSSLLSFSFLQYFTVPYAVLTPPSNIDYLTLYYNKVSCYSRFL